RREVTSVPFTSTAPSSGRSSAPARLSRVVLPDPERPSRTSSRPSSRARSRPARTGMVRPPALNCLVTARITRTGVPAKSEISWGGTSASDIWRDLVPDFVGGQDQHASALPHQAYAPAQTGGLDEWARHLQPAGAIHDHKLLCTAATLILDPARLRAGPSVSDHHHPVDVPRHVRVMGHDDRRKPE